MQGDTGPVEAGIGQPGQCCGTLETYQLSVAITNPGERARSCRIISLRTLRRASPRAVQSRRELRRSFTERA